MARGYPVKACPRCGLVVVNTCFHDGVDWRTVVMHPDDARRLRREFAVELRDRIEQLVELLSRYEAD